MTPAEIISIAAECCGDGDDENFCDAICPYLDVRLEEKHSPVRLCRQWVMHDLLKIIRESA